MYTHTAAGRVRSGPGAALQLQSHWHEGRYLASPGSSEWGWRAKEGDSGAG